MKKKNGFMFIETMIVIVTVLVSLLLIYSSYVGLRSVERRRVRYDDPAFIYKTYAIGKFLLSIKDDNDNSVIEEKIREDIADESNESYAPLINIALDDNDLYTNQEYVKDGNNHKQVLFSDILRKLNVAQIILISNKKIKALEKSESKIPSNFYDYIKSIDTSSDSDDQYYLIIEYAEKVNGESCSLQEILKSYGSHKTESFCSYYFSNMKLEIGG